LDRLKDKIDWGTPLDTLPVISRACFDRVSAEGFKLIIINDVVHDVSDFILEHPGGSKIMEPYRKHQFFPWCSFTLQRYCGKDATKAFTGGVYYHSNAARNAMVQYRIGNIDKSDNWSFEEVTVAQFLRPL
jgi:stearoyl-CoA desaturase (Delta-9 desaturase)